MRIQNNITAMNTHRQYTINNDNVAKNAEKLSSGYRINRAGDDAAGLAISEKMRSQIRGLNMATKNSQDAISLVQTAEGALQETHAMLQRMNELAVQAATGTNQESDRMALAKEFEQPKREINDVAEQTTFNNMKILDGSLSYKGYERSASTAGVNVTRPTNFDNASTAPTGGTATASISANDLGEKPTGKVTLEFNVGTATRAADGGSKTIKFQTKLEGDGNKTLKELFEGGFEGVENADGYSVEVDKDGKVTLTSTKEDLSGKNITLTLSGEDANGPINFETKNKPMQVAGVADDNNTTEPSAGTATTVQITGLGTESVSSAQKSVDVAVTVGNTNLKVTITADNANNSGRNTIGACITDDPSSVTVAVTLDDGSDAEGWSAAIDAQGNVTLTGPVPASQDEADAIAAQGGVTSDKGTVGDVTAGEPAGAAEAAAQARDVANRAAGDAAVTAQLAGSTDADLTEAVNAGEDAEMTVTWAGKTLTFTNSDAANASTVGALLNGATATDADGNTYTLTIDDPTDTAGSTFTISGPQADVGFSETAGDYTVAITNNGTAVQTSAGQTATNAVTAAVNGAEAPKDTEQTAEPTKGPAVKPDDVTTIEFEMNKMEVGDEVGFKIGDTTVTVKVTDTMKSGRDEFIKGLTAAIEADADLKAAMEKGDIKISGTAIVVKGMEVGEPVLTVDALENEPTTAMRIQVGALENEQLNIAIDSMNTKGLGLDGISLYDINGGDDQTAAGKAITAVRNAVLKVADQRATLGAMQNRLDHKIANLKVTSENLSAAESRIRDVDMASEMTQFTKNNILSQAATAMLAQANSLPQNVLSLLG